MCFVLCVFPENDDGTKKWSFSDPVVGPCLCSLQLFLLEELRERKYDAYARKIQKAWRRHRSDQYYHTLKQKGEAGWLNEDCFISLCQNKLSFIVFLFHCSLVFLHCTSLSLPLLLSFLSSFFPNFLFSVCVCVSVCVCDSKASDIMFNNKERKRLSINRNFVGDYCGFSENPSLRALVGEWAVCVRVCVCMCVCVFVHFPRDGCHILLQVVEGDEHERTAVLVYREEGENRLCSDGDQVWQAVQGD